MSCHALLPLRERQAVHRHESLPACRSRLPAMLLQRVRWPPRVFQVYRDLPAYRTMLDRGGAAEPVDVALVGDPATVKDEIKRLEDIGVTDLCAFVFHAEPDAFERTIDFLGNC